MTKDEPITLRNRLSFDSPLADLVLTTLTIKKEMAPMALRKWTTISQPGPAMSLGDHRCIFGIKRHPIT